MKEAAAADSAPHKLAQCGSGFLRPYEAFAALKTWVVEELLERSAANNAVRIWIPSCGTGEEAYSIAIVLLEHYLAYGRRPNLQIFATDADQDAIRTARAGVYSESDLIGVSLARVQRFFQAQGTNRMRVCAGLRDHVVFAVHDLEQDLPFSKLDLISCYNVPELGRPPDALAQLYGKLHFALNDGGFLLVHPEDSEPPSTNLFRRADPEGFVYVRLADSAAGSAEFRDESAFRSPSAMRPDTITAGGVRDDLLTSREKLLSANQSLCSLNRQLTARLEKLAAAHYRLTEVLAASEIAVLVLDRQLRVQQFTSPAGHLLNLRDEDLGHPWGTAGHGFDEQLAIDAQLAIETRTAIEKTIRGYFDGWYLRRVQAFRSDEDGCVVATYVDITLQVESDLQQRRFAAMLRDSADAIVVTDFEGGIVAWNRGAERLYGYTQAEALKLNIRDLMMSNRVDPTLEVMRRVARGEAIAPFDTQRRTRDGRAVEVSSTVGLLFDAAGNAESLAATERDITARRRAEDETRMLNQRLEQRVAERATELQHTEDQIRAILDATADAVVTIDVMGRIATFNRAAERIFGYSASEVIGRSVTLLVPAEERLGRYGYRATAIRSYASRLIGRSHEISGRRKDGSVFPIQLSVNSVEGRGLFVGVARDMTEYKALQKEIVDVAMLEQRRIGQELHDGAQQELTGLGLLALNLAEALSRSGSSTASQTAARIARGIEQCNQRMRALARGMVPVPVHREGLMTALAELARQTTEIHRLPCSFECPAPVEIDNDNEATHLYRIAQEAVNNATRHARASAIWIRLEQVDGRLILEVQDNGIGLNAELEPGKGVGLRLMEHRCAMIGGVFAIDPRPDGGTCIVCSVARAQGG